MSSLQSAPTALTTSASTQQQESSQEEVVMDTTTEVQMVVEEIGPIATASMVDIPSSTPASADGDTTSSGTNQESAAYHGGQADQTVISGQQSLTTNPAADQAMTSTGTGRRTPTSVAVVG